MSVIALINNKGGVGKTTTAVNLAAGLAQTGKTVLVVDLDAQASASLSLGVERSDLDPSLASVLYDGVPTPEVVRTAPGAAGVDLITAHPDLKHADAELASKYGRETLLKREVLEPVVENYDVVLLDCPPSLNLLPVNAIVAADWFLVPVEPHFLSLEGVGSLLDTVDQIREGTGEAASLLGFVVTRADFRANSTQQAIDILRDEYGKAMFETVVRGNVRVAEASSHGVSVLDSAPSSTGAEAYRNLTEEVVARLREVETSFSARDMQPSPD